jgi:hypothetical protein
MRYLFFDTESSNCVSGLHKMCEFGFVITDESFHVIGQNDILINPGAGRDNRFLLTGRANQEDCILAHEEDKYFASPEFETLYDNLKAILEQKDLVIFGFSLLDDMVTVVQACRRYHLEPIDFVAYDIQKFFKEDLGPGQKKKLVMAFTEMCGEEALAKLHPHSPVDDSYMTMKVLESLCKTRSLAPKDLIQETPESMISSGHVATEEIGLDGRPLTAKARAAGFSSTGAYLHYKKQYDSYFNLAEENKDGTVLKGQRIMLSGTFLIHPDVSLPLLKRLVSLGAIMVRNYGEAWMLCYDEEDKQRLEGVIKGPGITFLSLKEFESLIEQKRSV